MPNPFALRDLNCLRRAFYSAPYGGLSRKVPRAFLCASLFFCAICTSCGAVGGAVGSSAPPLPVTVSVAPNSAQPYQGGSVQFSATVLNAANTAVTWMVNQTPNGNSTWGTINTNGLYTAPAAVPIPPTVTVTAVWQSDATKTGSASVTIQLLSPATGTLIISPLLSSLTRSQTLQLQITTPGVANGDVNWAATGGTITSGGLYTPPNTQGAYTVTAALIANRNIIGTAQVEVTAFPGTLTWRNDNVRSGVNSQELALSPSTVSPKTFGLLFSCNLAPNEYPYAQPLYVPNLPIPGKGPHNVVFVATEMDSVYAFDADTNSNPCVPLWMTSLIPAGWQAIATPNLQITSSVIAPFVGITGTPVIDISASLLYVVAATETIAENPIYSEHLYALDLATGQPEILPSGAPITSPSGQAPAFYPTMQNQRAALLLNNGTVYIAFGSFGGELDYHGWLFGYDAATLRQTGSFDVTPDTNMGGIWQSGGGPSADSEGNVFAVTGDGAFNINRGELSYGNSFLRFGPSAGLSSVADYFTPCNQMTLQADSLGVGAGAPVLLPDSAGSLSQPHLLIGGSEGGSLYVVNRDDMGQYSTFPCPDSSTRVQTIPVPVGGAILSTPLFWNGAVYLAPANGNLMAFPMSGGMLASAPSAAQSPEPLGPQGATPVISANGTSNAILWLIDSSGALATPTNTPAILRAYDPNNSLNEIYNSTMAAASRDAPGLAVKFTVPTVANGKVYVGTQGQLDVYGLE